MGGRATPVASGRFETTRAHLAPRSPPSPRRRRARGSARPRGPRRKRGTRAAPCRRERAKIRAPSARARSGSPVPPPGRTAGQGDAEPTRPESIEVPTDVLRSTHGDDRVPLGAQDASAPRGEHLERQSVAYLLDEDDRAHVRRRLLSIPPPVDSALMRHPRCVGAPCLTTRNPNSLWELDARDSLRCTARFGVPAQSAAQRTVRQALTRPVVSAKVPLNWNRDTPTVSATIFGRLSAPTLASPPYHTSGQHTKGCRRILTKSLPSPPSR